MCKIIKRYLLFLLLFSMPLLGNNLGEVNIYIVALSGIIIVMISLLIIYLFIQFISWVIKYYKYRQLKIIRKKKNKLRIIKMEDNRPDIEAVLAISTAIHMEMKYKMEEENAILTINKLRRPYSPWSSKILSMRKVPDRK
ncbi:MAG: OadG family transporter subunit [Candidatus Marinimicrobia bacterium]|jgi:Na+-transporting methylmalonyl-CoA/oxaloacetate decarboxylase gamma subunit|nr:OadG family transporter subunit [Candidatus Neomarinimicrobiota bacterium]